jgi:predicted ATPase
MSFPPDRHEAQEMGTAEALQYDAVRLFRDRATAAVPTLTLTDEMSATVSHICRRLEGIPLAIELAAARVRLLTLKQIAARLDDSFHLLAAGNRLDRRHETLQAAMGWSYGLLTEKEQVLLSRLSVFAGGFTLEAAERVCGGIESKVMNGARDVSLSPQSTALAPSDVLDLLSSLQDKSLVEVERGVGEARSRLLEPVRQFALAKSRERGEHDLLRTRHLEFFAGLAEQAEPQLYGAGQLEWFRHFDREAANIRLALEWAQSQPDGERATAGLRLAGSLMWYWYARGYWTDVRSRLDALLAMRGTAKADAVRAKGLMAAGLIAFFQDDPTAARSALKELQAIAASLGPEHASLLALIQGCAAYGLMADNPTAARKFADGCSLLALRLPDPMSTWLRGFALMPVGRIAQQAGDYAAARAAFDTGLALFGRIGDVLFGGVLLGYCSSLSYHDGDYAATRSFLARSIAASRLIGHVRSIAHNLVQLGRLDVYEARYEQGRLVFEEALTLWREQEDSNMCAWTRYRLASLATHQEAYEQAAALYRENLPPLSASPLAESALYWLTGVAGLVSANGKPRQAVRLLSAVDSLAPSAAEQNESWRRLSGGFSRSFYFRVDPLDRAEYDGYLTSARNQLSESEFAAAWAEGAGLELDQAISSARAEIEAL